MWLLDSLSITYSLLQEQFKKHSPSTREEFKDDQAWRLIRDYFHQQLPDHMKAPTVGELKRVLAETPDIRRDIVGRASHRVVSEVKGIYGPAGVKTLLSQQALMDRLMDSDRLRLPGEHETKPWREFAEVDLIEVWAAVRWLYGLAVEAEAQVRAQRFDAMLPPPVPATPSTRARF